MMTTYVFVVTVSDDRSSSVLVEVACGKRVRTEWVSKEDADKLGSAGAVIVAAQRAIGALLEEDQREFA